MPSNLLKHVQNCKCLHLLDFPGLLDHRVEELVAFAPAKGKVFSGSKTRWKPFLPRKRRPYAPCPASSDDSLCCVDHFQPLDGLSALAGPSNQTYQAQQLRISTTFLPLKAVPVACPSHLKGWPSKRAKLAKRKVFHED